MFKRHWNVHVYITADGEKHKPYDIGYQSSFEELKAANAEARTKNDNYGNYYGGGDQKEMQRGAIDAFKVGRRENLQQMLAAPGDFRIEYRHLKLHEMLATLLPEGEDPAVLTQQLLEAVPAEDRQQRLDAALTDCLNSTNNEDVVAALLQSGADADAESGGFKGHPLAVAIQNSRPESTIRALYESGASFDDARFLMDANNWKSEYKDQLEAYRNKIAGPKAAAPAAASPADSDVLAIVTALREQVADLTAEVHSLRDELHDAQLPAATPAPAAQPAPATSPTRIDYKKVMGGPK